MAARKPAARRAKPPQFVDVIAAGDYRKSLESLRDELARSIGAVDGCHVAPLARQLADVLAKLDQIKPPAESSVDDLAAKRSARRATTVSEPAGQQVVGGTRSRRASSDRGSDPGSVAGGRARPKPRGKA